MKEWGCDEICRGEIMRGSDWARGRSFLVILHNLIGLSMLLAAVEALPLACAAVRSSLTLLTFSWSRLATGNVTPSRLETDDMSKSIRRICYSGRRNLFARVTRWVPGPGQWSCLRAGHCARTCWGCCAVNPSTSTASCHATRRPCPNTTRLCVLCAVRQPFHRNLLSSRYKRILSVL